MKAQQEHNTVTYQAREGIAWIHLNRPHRLNAVNSQLVEDLCAALDRGLAEKVRVAVLAGKGRAFCAGYDLKQEPEQLDEMEERRRMDRLQDITRKVRQAPFPVIASVQGYAMGAGCEFALCSDLIVAARDAQFGFPEVSVGLSVTGGISRILPMVVGHARAKELILLSKRFSAEEALQLGLVNRVVEPGELEAVTMELAQALRDQPPLALAFAKAVLDRGTDMDMESTLNMEVGYAAVTTRSSESAHAAASFRGRK